MAALDNQIAQAKARRGTAQERASLAELEARLFGARTRARVARYELVRLLGAGGGGTVFEALDPELDRRVALKLVDAELVRRTAGEETLIREARSLALLCHPNVVQVYDAGCSSDGGVFVVMELLSGPTLAQWLQTHRTTEAIVETFVAAGRGLAAAHAAGVLHRDFKPQNVIVSERVRVVDFGLAVELHTLPSDPDEIVAGTPAYMAPEQLVGAAVDASSDQYAFGVALFEALYGERPFRAETLGGLMDAKRSGRRDLPAPRGRDVPDAIQRALRRALDPDPARRFRSMAALLDALERRSHSRMIAAGLGGVVACGALVAFVSSPPRRCEAGADRLAEVWNPARAASLRDAYARLDSPFAEANAGAAIEALDAFASEWTAEHRRTCQDATSERLDATMACLEGKRLELDALAEVLIGADAVGAARAREAVLALREPASCGDETVRAEPPALQAELARVEGLHTTGDIASSIDAGTSLADAARLADAPAIEARALLVVAAAILDREDYETADELLERARSAALDAGDAEAEAGVYSASAFLSGRRHDLAATIRWSRHAHAVLDRLTTPRPELRMKVVSAEAIAHLATGDYARARDLYAATLELARDAYDDDDARLGAPLGALASAELAAGNPTEAIKLMTKAVEISERGLGAGHPDVARALHNLGVILAEIGDHEAAARSFERAFEIRKGLLGPDNSATARSRAKLGNELARLGELDGARGHLEAALASVRRTRGGEHPDVAARLHDLGRLELRSGRADRAVAHLEEAVVMLERVWSADHPDLITVKTSLAAARVQAGDAQRGLGEVRLVLDLLEGEEDTPAWRTAHDAESEALRQLGGDP